jgi:hypothetical protein
VRAWLALAAASAGAAACADQGFVAYQGTVTVAPDGDAGYDFGPDPNPNNLAPVPGATVSLCPAAKCTSVSDDAGSWGPIWQSFPLFGGSRTVSITVDAPGYASLLYSANYPSSPETTSNGQYLNLYLAPAAGGGAALDAGSAPDAGGAPDAAAAD